jgi:hypothetical protein
MCKIFISREYINGGVFFKLQLHHRPPHMIIMFLNNPFLGALPALSFVLEDYLRKVKNKMKKNEDLLDTI